MTKIELTSAEKNTAVLNLDWYMLDRTIGTLTGLVQFRPESVVVAIRVQVDRLIRIDDDASVCYSSGNCTSSQYHGSSL